jgi:hypothetical protein
MDLEKVPGFLATHTRVVDRRRFGVITVAERPVAGDTVAGDTVAEETVAEETVAEETVAEETVGLLAALAGYRNSDGGFGWGLEPDLRSPESQPAGALHAFEVLEEIAASGQSPAEARSTAVELCDWLATATLPDGGLPFALPVTDPAGCAPFWAEADSARSSLHITTAVAGAAHLLARYEPAVRDHAWLTRATAYCWSEITGATRPMHAIELRYVLLFLDAVHETQPGAPEELRRIGGRLPPDGVVAVEGGSEGEALRPLDYAPLPDRPLRALLPATAIEADLDRLGRGQQADGGWTVDFASSSPAGALEWRGYATVAAVKLLRANGRI